jgi:hypothetical protein
MEILIMFLALTALAILGPLYGTDSRDLRDHAWEDNPWDHLPLHDQGRRA